MGGDRAFYATAEGYVQVPPPQAYFEPINWHRTALHELGHATGHSSRLNRDQSGSYGTKKYAFEELVAELSSAFSCASLGIVPTVRHAEYIGSWLEVLREDNRAIVRAASQASKARTICSASFLGLSSPHRWIWLSPITRRRDAPRDRARVRGGRLFATGWKPRESLTAARRGEPR
ncbi:zincin-like metallopeptidase domain-containing protein [Bradyrhizobium sp. USDA 3397]